ncbi:MAG: cation:proton antiporter [Pseudonocardia sp.]
MDLGASLDTLLAIVAVAAVAPLLVAALPGPRIPQVVLLLAGGILIGPQVLDLGAPDSVQILADVGLGFVFLLAGYEVAPRLFAQSEGRRAVLSWLLVAALACGVVGLLELAGLVRAFVPVAVALTTTGLGILLPILRENGMLAGRLGRYAVGTGAVGELFPILAIALFLGIANRYVALVSLLAVAVLALALGGSMRLVRRSGLLAVIERGQHETTQTTLRLTVLLLLLLLAVTNRFHLDAVLGAFVAGMVLRRWSGGDAPVLEGKLDAIGYGFFVPIFFVYSGMVLDLRSVIAEPLRMLMFVGLLVALRVLPVLLCYRTVLSGRERVALTLLGATTLPLLVALAEIGSRNGTMLPQNAAALVGAGMLTVLVFPALAVALHRPDPAAPAPAGDGPDRAGRASG